MAVERGQLLELRVHDLGEVAHALAERRKDEHERRDAVKEVHAQARGVGAEVLDAVGGRDDARVDGAFRRAADAADRAVLERAEQVGLELERELADLVEEERAVGGLEEVAVARFGRAGERALLVPEQLARDQLLRDAAAVHRDVRAVRALGAFVDHAGEQVLARAGLAEDEDAALGLGRLERHVDRAAEHRIVADQELDRGRARAAAGAGHRDERGAADREIAADQELGALDRGAIDERAVARVAIADEERAVLAALDHAVAARHERIADDRQVTVRIRADDPAARLGVERDHLSAVRTAQPHHQSSAPTIRRQRLRLPSPESHDDSFAAQPTADCVWAAIGRALSRLRRMASGAFPRGVPAPSARFLVDDRPERPRRGHSRRTPAGQRPRAARTSRAAARAAPGGIRHYIVMTGFGRDPCVVCLPVMRYACAARWRSTY